MAFHPYPRVIPPVFNPGGFGPPRGLTPASACPGIAHPASRLRPATGIALFRLAFAPARFEAWPRRQPRLAGSFYKRHAVTACSSRSDCSKAHGFRCCFTPLSGCFSPFPHGTRSLSVAGECSDLEGGPPGFGPDSSWPALLGKEVVRSRRLRLRGSHPVPPAFPGRSAADRICHRTPGLEPRHASPRNTDEPAPPGCDGHVGLGIARVRSPLLARSRLISLPPGT